MDLNSEVGKLGLTLQDLDDNTRSKLGLKQTDDGVLVSKIEQNSPAANLGVSSGDIIKKIGTDNVTDISQVETAIQDIRKNENDTVLMLVQKGTNLRYIAVPFEQQNS